MRTVITDILFAKQGDLFAYLSLLTIGSFILNLGGLLSHDKELAPLFLVPALSLRLSPASCLIAFLGLLWLLFSSMSPYDASVVSSPPSPSPCDGCRGTRHTVLFFSCSVSGLTLYLSLKCSALISFSKPLTSIFLCKFSTSRCPQGHDYHLDSYSFSNFWGAVAPDPKIQACGEKQYGHPLPLHLSLVCSPLHVK